MPDATRSALLLAAVALAACSRNLPLETVPTATPQVTATMDALQADSVADSFISRLLESESDLAEPDSLFGSDATVFADGEPRGSVPRLAGVGLGGTVQLVTSRVATRGAFVWGVIEYRWLPMFDTDAMRVGVATLVIARLPDGSWRIVHLHSSSPRPPDTPQPEPPDSLGDPGRGEASDDQAVELRSPLIVSRILAAVPGEKILMIV